jgi:hypothetical protein
VHAGKRHLDDSALIRRYLAERGLEALDPSDETILRHLVGCPSCEARYVEVLRTFDEARDAVLDRADSDCSPERMAEQRDRILRRVDALYDGPRVLPFRKGTAAAPAAAQTGIVKGWIAAAAVAGLVIGLTVGQLFHLRSDAAGTARGGIATLSAPHSAPVLRSPNGPPPVDEDQFLSDVDLAAAGPQNTELRAIYAFTLETPRDAIPTRARKN